MPEGISLDPGGREGEVGQKPGLDRQTSGNSAASYNRMESIMAVTKNLSRKLSAVVTESISSEIGDTMPTSVAVVFTMNMVLGTGPLTLPFAFAQAGLILGSGFLLFCALLGYLTATYVIESLAAGNAIMFEGAEDNLLWSPGGTLKASAESEEQLASTKTMTKSDIHKNTRHVKPEKVFKIRERIELGQLGGRLLPRPLWIIVYIVFFLYTFGTLSVYAVTVTTSVEELIPFNGKLGFFGKHEVVVLAWTAIVVPLCFADLQKLKSVQSVVMVMRLLVILVMIGASYLEIAETGVKPIPTMKPEGIPSLYANGVLAFMVHHSLPGIIAPLEKQAEATKVIATAYGISYVIYLILVSFALAAFGENVAPMFNLAFNALPLVISKFLEAYPLTIISVYPIVGITLRNNILNALGLGPPKPGNYKAKDYLATGFVTLAPSAVAYMTSDVQTIVSFFAGYFGLSLMLAVPCMLVSWYRWTLSVDVDDEFALKSRWAGRPIQGVILICWLAAIIFNTWRLFFMH